MELLLYGTSFIFFLFTYYFHQKEKNLFTQTTKTILFTATVIYSFMGMLFANNPDTVIRLWRYLDWFITVPLLIYEMSFFLKEQYKSKSNLIFLITNTLLMLTFGLLGELNYVNKLVTNLVGSLFMFIVFYTLITEVKKEHKTFFMLICITWMFYPTVYLFNDSLITIILFSFSDLIAKIGSSLYIDRNSKSI